MAVDLTNQASEAREQGLAEVFKLLSNPDDLSRLSEIRTDFHNKFKASKTGISSVVQSQIEATRLGVGLLDKAHRTVVKLCSNLDKINQ